jgi:hypothetical protein
VFVGALALVVGLTGGFSKKKSSDKATADAAVSASKIELPAKLHDFGNVTEGDKLKHVFEIKNTGTSPLVIDRVSTSCGCTVAEIKTKQIAPGEKGDLEVTFDTTGRRGQNRKAITIISNDSSNPRAQIEVAANIESLLALEPFFVRLSPDYNEEQTRDAWLVGKLVDQAKVTITEKEKTDEAGIDVQMAEKDENGKKVPGVRFKLKGKKVGYGSGRVVLATGLENPKELVLRYSWSVKGNVRVLPAQLYFDERRPQQKERTLKVTSNKPDFKVSGVQVLSGPFKAELVKPDGGAGFEVKVTLTGEPPKTEPGAEAGKLIITSNDALEPKKEIPIRMSSGRPQPGRPGALGGPGAPPPGAGPDEGAGPGPGPRSRGARPAAPPPAAPPAEPGESQ